MHSEEGILEDLKQMRVELHVSFQASEAAKSDCNWYNVPTP